MRTVYSCLAVLFVSACTDSVATSHAGVGYLRVTPLASVCAIPAGFTDNDGGLPVFQSDLTFARAYATLTTATSGWRGCWTWSAVAAFGANLRRWAGMTPRKLAT